MRRILHHVAIGIFLQVENGLNLSNLVRISSSNYATISRLINKFKNAKLIETKKMGREKKIYLTDKGKLVKEKLRKIK